eukprot:GFUD01028123.1.p1 GENE.GFUD01028123.1~~GFUD01028123.1.p1  ORF type:complete len:150 (-),score=34.74 GFUD01028123.1:21-470(-)
MVSGNVLLMNGIAKHVRSDDLYDFFWKGRCVIDEISISAGGPSGQGFVNFRLREDAEAWAGKVIIVNSTKIKFALRTVQQETSGGKSEQEKNLDRKRTRSREDERNRSDSDRNDGWRHRSRERSTRGKDELQEGRSGVPRFRGTAGSSH